MMDGARKRSVRAALSLHGTVEMTTWQQQATYTIGPPRGQAGIGARHRMPRSGLASQPCIRSHAFPGLPHIRPEPWSRLTSNSTRRTHPILSEYPLVYTTSNKL